MTTAFDNLSEEAQEVALGMIEYCINHGCCMGMDEGLDLDTGKAQPFRRELEQLVGWELIRGGV